MHFPAWMIATDGLKVVWHLRRSVPAILVFPALLMSLGAYLLMPAPEGAALSIFRQVSTDLPGYLATWGGFVLLCFKLQCCLFWNIGGAKPAHNKECLTRYFLQAGRITAALIIGGAIPIAVAGYIVDSWLAETSVMQVLAILFMQAWMIVGGAYFYRAALSMPTILLQESDFQYPYGKNVSLLRSFNMLLATHFTTIIGCLLLIPIVLLLMVLGGWFGKVGLALLNGVTSSLVLLIYATLGTAHYSALVLGRDLTEIIKSDMGKPEEAAA